jgi:tetratricopeptide (TPR) repeat protein
VVVTSAVLVAAASGAALAWGWRASGPLRWLLAAGTPAPPQLSDEAAAAARRGRQKPVAELAPTAMPAGLPLLGTAGTDEYGMPTQYIDGPALRSLLVHKEYAKLRLVFERLQQEFAADQRKEYWPLDAATAFSSAEPALRAELDAWVKASPGAFAPYLARGMYLTSVAWARRGFKFAKETHASDFAAMKETLPLALADLEQALALEPGSVVALQGKIRVFQGQSQKQLAKAALGQAVAICPSCFQVRVGYLMLLRPRWFGSRAEMTRFASNVGTGDKKLYLLRGYPDWDQAQTLQENKEHEAAQAAIEKACAVGTHWEFLVERGEIERQLKREKAALDDMNAAWAARPGEPTILRYRTGVYYQLKRWEDAGRDLLALLRTRPTDGTARADLDTVVKGLVYDGWEKYKAGDRNNALRLYDLAAELAPRNLEVMQRRAWVLEGRAAGPSGAPGDKAPDLAELERARKENPDDLRAHQQLDYNLARQGRFAEVIEMWNGYIARHPSDGRAYLERGGAYFHLRKIAEAKADAAKACELGISEGCMRAK